ncbi:MAG: HNH endonuclease [Solobacterium sp.]|nr:HNH endonuclease [Solobacterium sp.]
MVRKGKSQRNDKSRPDQTGSHRGAFEKNKKKILLTQSVCGICGQPVDKKLKYPHPMSPCIDHIIPIAKGGHPSDMANLQLAHWSCNRQKSDKILRSGNENIVVIEETISNRNLPQSCDWKSYRARKNNVKISDKEDASNKQTTQGEPKPRTKKRQRIMI